MAANGYLEQRRNSPISFGAVVMLHGAAIAAVVLMKGPGWIVDREVDVKTYNVRPVAPPPPETPPPDRLLPQTPSISRIDVPKQVIQAPVRDLNTIYSERVTGPTGPVIGDNPGPRETPALVDVPPRVPDRIPVRVDAQFDPRFASALQPPYPLSEQRQEREGRVQVRVTIGPDGRVVAAQRLSATNDAFWRVTERQALSRWRFRPATVDGRPIQSSKVLNVHFRLDGQ